MAKHKNMGSMFDIDALTATTEKPEKAAHFSLDKGIDNLAGALCDPIIVHGCAWATREMIPEWLRNRITLDRMIELMLANNEERDPIGTNSEALAYLIPASMEAPMGHDWTQIYLYLATRVIDGEKDKVVPEDIRVEKLDRNQEEDLLRLKRWIYETELKHRAGQRQEIKREIKEDKKREKEKVEAKDRDAKPSLFDF